MNLILDKHLTAWQLYHMALEPDFEPILPLIVLHENAYPALQAWYEQYQTTGVIGEIPEPDEPEVRGLFARKGKLPSLQQVDAYVREKQASVQHNDSKTPSVSVERLTQHDEDDEVPALLPGRAREDNAPFDKSPACEALPSVDSASKSFDERVRFAFDWRIIKRAGFVILVCAVLVALFFGGWRWYQSREQQRFTQAQSACTASRQHVQANERAFTQLLNAKQTRTVLDYQEQDVADSQVLTTLRKAAKTPTVRLQECHSEQVEALQEATKANTAMADTLNKRTRALRKAGQAAQTSHVKQLAGQRGELQVAMNGAQALLDSSSGKVADNATRDALQQALNQARSVYEDKHVNDVSMYINAGKILVDAQSAVQASIDAKVQADEQARSQAAQDAQPQQSTLSPNYVTAPHTSPSKPQLSQPTEPPTWSVPDTTPNPLPDTDGSL